MLESIPSDRETQIGHRSILKLIIHGNMYLTFHSTPYLMSLTFKGHIDSSAFSNELYMEILQDKYKFAIEHRTEFEFMRFF